MQTFIAPTHAPTARRSVMSHGTATKTFEEAVAAINYGVSKETVYDADGKALPREYRGMFNTKTREAIGVVGHGFTFYQPSESLEIMQAAVSTVSGAKWRSVISTHGGAHLCAFAELPEQMKAPNRGDLIGMNFFMRDWFNGTGRNVWGINAIVRTCTNGAIGTRCLFSIGGKHTPNLKSKVEAVRLELAMKIQDEVEKFRGFVYKLDNASMDRAEMNDFSLRLFGVDSEEALNDDDITSTQLRNKVETVRVLFDRGTGNIGKSRWDAYNAVTEFTDWHSTFRSTQSANAEENRFLSLLGGNVASLKDRAADLLVQ